MASLQHCSSPLALALVLFLAICHQVSALPVEYCSDINTSTNNKNSSIFQSNGLCYTFCQENYAFAILQDDGCWCSNYAPASTTTGCDGSCPGYPDDKCGGTNLYGYIALPNTPSGTEGGSAAAASSTIAPSSTSPTLAKITTSSAPSSTWTPTPVTSLETVTGELRTVTVTPTVPPNSLATTGVTKSKSSGGLSTGAAVGLTIGLVALVAIICAIIYFCIRKRREAQNEELANASRRGSSAGLGGAPSRTMSQNSRFVLNTDGHRVVENWENGDVPGSRRSKLIPVDPRLDPFSPVYQRGSGDNKSRESINTIRDDHDYSRRVHQQAPILRATNPDNLED